ncbi:NS88 [Scophthalmus maximus reovirus]|uniref:NS88 n=1 Tax=Scophthalmus maximus reovirus TaxID=994485 RepID=F2WJK9_9REOV|nr:NS88 [Scophthalmus maximus reovirus]ADZ31979.1 NS88 [Scophthalmus maximus reovirus]
MAARINLRMLSADSSLTTNKPSTPSHPPSDNPSTSAAAGFQSLPNLSFRSPPTWSLTYKGVAFHGVCDPPCEPFIPIAGYLSQMISHMTPSSEPHRIEDVNNLVAVGLSQLGVTPSMSLGEVEVLLNDRVARVHDGSGPFFDPVPAPVPAPLSPVPAATVSPPPPAPPASLAPAVTSLNPALAAAPTLKPSSVPTGTQTLLMPLQLTAATSTATPTASPTVTDALSTTRADCGPTSVNEPSTLWSESALDEFDGPAHCSLATNPPLIDGRLYSQVVQPPVKPVDQFIVCDSRRVSIGSTSKASSVASETPALMELNVTPASTGPRRPPRPAPGPFPPRTGRRRAHHIADDNTYNEARLAYARGRPTTSPLYNQGLEIHSERAFFSSFPHHINGKWVAPTSVLNVVAGADEDLNDSTIHSVRATDCSGMYEVTATNGEVISRLNVMFIDSDTTSQALTHFITPHSLIAITPYAAALMVQFRLTKGVFSKSHRRMVMGIDPVMIHLNSRGVALWNVLTQHLLEYAELYASASLRDLVTALLDPVNVTTMRWMKRTLPNCVAAVCEMRTDPIPTLSHILNVETPTTPVSSAASSLKLSELQAENTALTSQISTLEAQLEAATLSLATTRESIQREQAVHSADSLKQYLHDHVCVNCHEEPFLNATVGVEAAGQILSARQNARERAADKVRQAVSAGFAETVTMLQERNLSLDQRVKATVDELNATATQLRSALSRLSSAEGRSHDLVQRNELLESQLVEARQLSSYQDSHQKETITALQTTIRDSLPYTPVHYGQGQFTMPSLPPVRSMMPDFDPSDLLM